ncbi:hypothetical protein F5X96DRAFT_675464 [Biscogniauxia mediterranea]|nr:hypothetical protein F5X96DRAFT_675464 [Biscogniauxia mediterranea]
MRLPKSLVIMYAMSLGCAHGASIPLSGTAQELAARMELPNDEVVTRAVEGEVLSVLIINNFEDWIVKNDWKTFPDPQKDTKNYQEKVKGFWDKAEQEFSHGHGAKIKESVLALFTINGNSRATLELPPDGAIKAARKILNGLKEKSSSDQEDEKKEVSDETWKNLDNMVADGAWWGQMDSIYPQVEGYTKENARRNAGQNENILRTRGWEDMTDDQAIFIINLCECQQRWIENNKDTTWPGKRPGQVFPPATYREHKTIFDGCLKSVQDATKNGEEAGNWYTSTRKRHSFPTKQAYNIAKPIYEKLTKKVNEESGSDKEEAAKKAGFPEDWEELWKNMAPELDVEFNGLKSDDSDLSGLIDENGDMIINARARTTDIWNDMTSSQAALVIQLTECRQDWIKNNPNADWSAKKPGQEFPYERSPEYMKVFGKCWDEAQKVDETGKVGVWYNQRSHGRFPSKMAIEKATKVIAKLVEKIKDESGSDREDAVKDSGLPENWKELFQLWKSTAPELDVDVGEFDSDLNGLLDANGNMIIDKRAKFDTDNYDWYNEEDFNAV